MVKKAGTFFIAYEGKEYNEDDIFKAMSSMIGSNDYIIKTKINKTMDVEKGLIFTKIVSHDNYQPLYRDDSYHDDLTHSYQKRYHRKMR